MPIIGGAGPPIAPEDRLLGISDPPATLEGAEINVAPGMVIVGGSLKCAGPGVAAAMPGSTAAQGPVLGPEAAAAVATMEVVRAADPCCPLVDAAEAPADPAAAALAKV